MNISSKLITLIQFIATAVFFLLWWQGCKEKKELSDMNIAAQDTMVQYRNKFGQQVSEKTVLLGSMKDLQSLNSKKDSMLQRLQQIVDKHTTSATVITGNTHITGSGASTISHTDTVRTGDTLRLFPEYHTYRSDRWHSIDVTATKDSIHYELMVLNDFSVAQKYERNGFLKPRKLTVQVVNNNPYTVTTNIQSFSLHSPKKRTGVFLLSGFAVGVITSLIILK